MAKPKKGVIPPQLKKYLFKRRKAKRAIEKIRRARLALDRKTGRVSRLRRKNPVGHSRVGVRRLRHALAKTRRASAPKVRRVYGIITATRGGTRLHYDGRHFSKTHAPRKFPTLSAAEQTARVLLKKFPVLRGYAIEVRLSH